MREKQPGAQRKKGMEQADVQAHAGAGQQAWEVLCVVEQQGMYLCFCWLLYMFVDLSVPLVYSFIQSIFIEGLLCGRPVLGEKRKSIEYNVFKWTSMSFFQVLWFWGCLCVCVCIFLCICDSSRCVWQWSFFLFWFQRTSFHLLWFTSQTVGLVSVWFLQLARYNLKTTRNPMEFSFIEVLPVLVSWKITRY